MKIYLLFFNRYRRLALTVSLSSLLGPGCSAPKDPKIVGQQTANVLCETSRKEDEATYAQDIQLAAEIKAGKINTRTQFQARYAELSKSLNPGFDIASRTKQTDSLVAQLDADFPNRADRLAVGQVIGHYVDRCDSALQARRKQRPDTHLRQLRAQLTGSEPVVDSEGNELPPPPPPPSPEDLQHLR